MAAIQPEVADNVIAFPLRPARRSNPACCLTPRDRMVLTAWHDKARVAGYDRMVIHERDAGDAADVGNFLSIHRNGETWSRWGFAREGEVIRAWCSISNADMGEFASLEEALVSVLTGSASQAVARRKTRAARSGRRTAAVTRLVPRIAACG